MPPKRARNTSDEAATAIINRLPDMIQASALFVLSWTIGHYFSTQPNPEAYIRYLRHSLQLAQWLDRQKPELAALVRRYRNVT
mgnify:CR=1 FL=1